MTIEYEQHTVTRPNQITVAINASDQARFGAKCRDCPTRPRCTTRAAAIELRRLINLGLAWNPEGWALHPD